MIKKGASGHYRKIDGQRYELVDASSTKAGAKKNAESIKKKYPTASVRIIDAFKGAHVRYGVYARKR